MSQRILTDIPKLQYGQSSAVCFIGALMALMEAVGDPVAEDEAFALTGVGLCFPWQVDSACDEVSVTPKVLNRALGAFGYENEVLTGEALQGLDKAACFEKIKKSIDGGKPVVGLGITTDAPMACLIVGYDDGGLYTRAYFAPQGADADAEDYFYSVDWHENCAGLVIMGDKVRDRCVGAAAYNRIGEWALDVRCSPENVKAAGKDIYLNRHAFFAMAEWLLDDAQWQNPQEGNKEMWLKQCGLLLFGHYRWQLWKYLQRLEAENSGLVNPPVFALLETINKAIVGWSQSKNRSAARPCVLGSHESDLWLHEAVDKAIVDFDALKDRALREKVAQYVHRLREYDDRLQWSLFMPDMVKEQQKGFRVENFEYLDFPAMRFVGVEDGGADADNAARRTEAARVLDGMAAYKSGFGYDMLLIHHHGQHVDTPPQLIWGRFMKADAPVPGCLGEQQSGLCSATSPDGFVSVDFVPHDVKKAGQPYYSRFAFATFSDDVKAMHAAEGFDVDAMYDITRNIILGQDVCIPYPEKYWTAEVFIEGFEKESTGYLFSVGLSE